jgi:hypothetical protein
MNQTAVSESAGPRAAQAAHDASTEPEHRAHIRRVRSAYEWMHLIADFTAAMLFVAGSVAFFYPSAMHAGTWMFLIGSICFALKPTLRLASRLHEARILRRIEEEARRIALGDSP